MTVITTSTAATATAYSNQRKIDRTSNGVLWATFYYDGATEFFMFRYSTDNGVTWIDGGNIETSSGSYVPNSSLFIDVDDYAHFVYKAADTGYIYYRRGTPNAGRTAWTWSAADSVAVNTAWDYPDVVAHREGTGWKVHIVSSVNDSNSIHYTRRDIAANGTLTTEGGAFIAPNYGNTNHRYPSIDFNHTGDGKTVAGGTPHLYVAWSAGATGAGNGIRFKKATYSGGTWTWGTEREIDSTRYNPGSANWLSLLFDGTRCIIGGYLAGTTTDVVLYERDAADTATATRVLVSSAGTASANYHRWGSLTYDASGNVYFFASNGDNIVFYRIWERASTTYGPTQTIDSSAGTSPYITSKRGYSGGRVEFIYTDGTASPYAVTFDKIVLNTAPVVTLANITTIDPRVSNTVSWTYSDADSNPQSNFELDYRPVGGTWASLGTGTTVSSYAIPANTLLDETDYEIRVRVSDGTAWSSYDTKTFRADSWTYFPEVTSSSNVSTISTASLDKTTDYEVQVRAYDGYDYSPWDSATMLFTKHYVYVNGAWMPMVKKEYWVSDWKVGRSSKF